MSDDVQLSIVILAAGQGRRMVSKLPKVLHELGGLSLLRHVHRVACTLPNAGIHVVFGHGGDALPKSAADLPVSWVEQKEQAGTGHALGLALQSIPDTHQVLVLYGDVPLIQGATLRALLDNHAPGGVSLLTAFSASPAGYGRVLRDAEGRVTGIVEERDASEAQRCIGEVNTGTLLAAAVDLRGWLQRVGNDNAQGEYYLTDCAALAMAAGRVVRGQMVEPEIEVRGINDRVQLAEAERYYQRMMARQLMQRGVSLSDPGRIDVRTGNIKANSDSHIDINVILEGDVSLGHRVHIGPNCHIRDAVIEDDVVILANCVIEDAVVGKSCHIGPFARIRPHTRLAESVHIGNFVEVKRSNIGPGSKANHLSYIGDCEVGRASNIGAGVITCNYDGAKKHKTHIGDRVFVGSDVQFVAPVRVGDGATIAAGATITKDVAGDALAISRAEQRAIPNWRRPKRR